MIVMEMVAVARRIMRGVVPVMSIPG